MASREETLLFLVDVQVRGLDQLKRLDAELAAADAARVRQLLALNQRVNGGNGATLGTVTNGIGDNGRTVVVPNGAGTPPPDRQRIVGVRGPERPGSRVNPIVFAQESGTAAGLGSLAAPPPSAPEPQQAPTAPTPAPVSPQAEKSWITQAAERVAAAQGSVQQERTVETIQQTARAMFRTQRNIGEPSSPLLVAAQQVRAASDEARMVREAARAVAMARQIIPPPPAPSAPPLSAAEAAHRLGVSRTVVYDLAGSGQLPGAVKRGGAWQIPQQAVIDHMAAGGGGDAGGGPPVVVGGGGGGGRNPWARRALWGGGLLGLAGLGTLGSFAGLGPEHLIMTAAGIAGSGASALGGAGLLGLGAAGTMAVGGGADALAMRTAANNVKALNTALNNLSQAQAVYGKNSRQATVAQQQLNYAMASAGPAAQSALAVANQLQALQTLWGNVSAGAQKQANNIFSQVLTLATQYAPMVAAAAQRNLTIINGGLKPLFTWLSGPQGVGIFHDLENQFATSLPSAVHAFNQAVELLLRVTDIASRYTGGFTQHLDRLFTRLNSMSNISLNNVIGKLIADFRLWEHFVKALITDIARLFSNDVGTGNSIIQTLTNMLVKLGQWEQSIQGRQSLMTLFTVHKDQIQALLQVLPLLVNAFAPIYLLVAPAMTTAFTAVLKAIEAVVRLIESLPGGAFAVGMAFLLAKFGLLAPLLAKFKLGIGGAAAAGAAGALGGGAAAGAVGGTSASIGAGALTGTVESGVVGGAAGGGLTAALTAGRAAIAAAAASAIPIVLAGGAMTLILNKFGTPDSQAPGTPGHPGILNPRVAPFTSPTGTAGMGAHGPSPQQIAISQLGGQAAARQTLQQFANTAGSAVTLGGMKLPDLQALVTQGQELARAFPQYAQVIDKLVAKIRSDLVPLEGVWKTLTDRWHGDATFGLAKLKDIFDTNTRLIAHDIGLNSTQGRQAMADQVKRMVDDVTHGMLDGKISVSQGMKAIRDALRQGMQDGAVSWDTAWHSMFNTVNDLYAHHKISTKQYYADLHQIASQGDARITHGTEQANQQMFDYLKGQMQQGNLTHQAFLKKWHDYQTQANTQAQTDMSAFAAAIIGPIAKVTQQGGQGLTDLIASVNSALKLLGAAPLTGLQISVMTGATGAGNATRGGASGGSTAGHQGAAHGMLMQIGRPGEAGHDTVPMRVAGQDIVVAPGEVVGVFNRHQLPVMNRALHREGYAGLPGLFSSIRTPHHMASGGLVGYAGGGVTGQGSPRGVGSQGGAPGYTGYALPVPRSMMDAGNWSLDMGVDIPGGAGGEPEFAIGPGTIIGEGIGGFGPNTPILRIDAGPLAGRTVYYGHAGPDLVRVGQHVVAGQQISTVGQGKIGISTGPHIEFGFYPPVGGGGAAMAAVLRQLLSGAGVTGIGGAAGIGGVGAISIPVINAPGVHGHGPLADMTRAGLAKVAKAANAYLALHAPASGLGPAGITGTAASGTVPGPLVTASEFGGHNDPSAFNHPTASGAIANDSLWGFAELSNPPGSHNWSALGGLPMGTRIKVGYNGKEITVPKVDVGAGGSPIPPASVRAIDLTYAANAALGAPGLENVTWARAALGGLFADGGLLQMFTHGGTPDPSKALTPAQKAFIARYQHAPRPIRSWPQPRSHHPMNPAPKTIEPGTLGAGGPFPFETDDLNQINNALTWILGLDGAGLGVGATGDATTQSNLINWFTNLWSSGKYPTPNFQSWGNPADFIITTDPTTGRTITPYISPHINDVAGQLGQILGYQGQWVTDLQAALGVANGVDPQIQQAIKRRADEVAKITKRIKDNLAKIKALQDKIADEQKKKKPYPKPKNKAERDANNDFEAARKARIAGWQAEITRLQDENNQLGGSKTSVGTGGELGTIATQLGTPPPTDPISTILGTGTGASGLYQLLNDVHSWETQLGGTGGDIAQQQLQQSLYQQGLDTLLSGADTALKIALAAQTPPGGTNPMTGTVAFTYNGQTYTAGMASGGIIGLPIELPPFGGSFYHGGTVPGAPGEPRTIIAHGGEKYLGVGATSHDPHTVAALRELTHELRQHGQSVQHLAQATRENTTATGGLKAAFSYGGGGGHVYPASLSSDTTVNVHVGN